MRSFSISSKLFDRENTWELWECRKRIGVCSEQTMSRFAARARKRFAISTNSNCNFRPSQKSPIPLNRYDDFVDDLSQRSRSQDQTPEPRLVARALYNFVGQSSRELTFRRGDIIFVRRQVDKNWYEGEYNAMIGLFPSNYVEVIAFFAKQTLVYRQ